MKYDQQKKLKIAQILYSGLGGHGSVAFSLLEGSAVKQWRNLLGFLGVEPLLPGYREYCEERHIPYRYFRAVSKLPFLAWPKITTWLYQSRPDAILLHSVKALLPCLLYSAIFFKPLVVIEHQSNALKTYREWWVTKFGMLFATKVVYLTENYALEVREKIGKLYRVEKVVIIPNGVDLARFSPAKKEPLSGKRVVIGMAARFTNMRRQDVLVAALGELNRRAPETDWHLSLAGDGVTLASIRSMIADNGLQNRVTVAGHLDEDELIEWFHGLDVYAHASAGETLSTSMLQAMACGLPVVASDVPGIRNLLSEQKEIGRLVEQLEPEAFAAVIHKLSTDVIAARQMGVTARRIVVENYSHTKMFEKYKSLINQARE